MNAFMLRLLTSVGTGFLFFFSYAYSVHLFCAILAGVALYISLIEWPPLMGGFTSVRFWIITPFYPLLPMVLLIFYVMKYYAYSFYLPLYPFLIAWGCDTASYFVGSLVGRHKIVPKISPGKSWEGLAGGTLAVFIINYCISPYIKALFPPTMVCILSVTIVGTVLSFLGDIFVSFLKRQALVKDTGNILPGHGGLLDRFDSLMFVSAAVFIVSLFLAKPI